MVTGNNMNLIYVPTTFEKLQIAEVRVVQSPATLWKRCAIAENAERRRLFWTCSKQMSPVTPERRPQSVSRTFKKVADRRDARSAVASNAVETL